MHHAECGIKTSVQSVGCTDLFVWRAGTEDGFAVFDDVTELIIKELVENLGAPRELAAREGMMDVPSGGVQTMKDPLLTEMNGSRGFVRFEIRRQISQHILGSLPNLIAKSTISNIKRIDDVAETFTHLPPFRVAY